MTASRNPRQSKLLKPVTSSAPSTAIALESAYAPELVLEIQGLSKSFGPLLANDRIDLTLHRGEVLALLGENGAGKSTLVSQIFGHYVPDAGQITVFGAPLPAGRPDIALSRGLGMVHQHFTLADNLSVLDNILVGTEPLLGRVLSFNRIRRQAREKLVRLGEQFGLAVNPDALIADLSVGERQRVEILKALYRGAKLLILDEPTAVLTQPETEALFATLQELIAQGLAIIFISHKLNEVMAIAQRVVVLRQGRVVGERDIQQTNRNELAELMVGRVVKKVEKTTDHSTIQRQSAQAIRPIFSYRQASPVIEFDLLPGEILAIAGVAGNGQHQLAQELMTKQLLRYPTLVAGRISDDRQGEGVVGDAPIWENAIIEDIRSSRFSTWGFVRKGNALAHTKDIIEKFDVRTPSALVRTAKLSGGNMQKLILGRNLLRQPQVIFADQPTWGLDVGAVAFVHQQLLDAASRGAAVLLISEDLDEVLALADRIAVMYKGKLSPALPTSEWTMQSLGLAMSGASS